MSKNLSTSQNNQKGLIHKGVVRNADLKEFGPFSTATGT